jgi:hypothetical protein
MYTARVIIEETLQDSPSLLSFLPEALAWAYVRVREDAAKETGLPLTAFPETCRWNMDQLKSSRF